MKNTSKGLKHFFKAFCYSIDGFKWILKKEVAFKHDIIFAIVAITSVVFLSNFNFTKIAIITIAVLILLITELLNTAIECVVDMVSPQYNILAKAAKDMCSAAVFLAVIVAIITWLSVLFLPL